MCHERNHRVLGVKIVRKCGVCGHVLTRGRGKRICADCVLRLASDRRAMYPEVDPRLWFAD